MFYVFMCAAVSHRTLMISKLRFTIYFGVIIPFVCTFMCNVTAQDAPAFPVGEFGLQYELDASESTIVVPGQQPIYSCLEAVVPGVTVQWLKDDVSLGSIVMLPVPIPPTRTSKPMKRRSLRRSARSSQNPRQHSRRAKLLGGEHEKKFPDDDRDPQLQRRLSSVSDTKYTPHNVTTLPRYHPHDSTTYRNGFYLSDKKFFLYGNGSLSITNHLDTSVGEYKCIVSDSFGSFLRRKFRIRIANIPQCSIKPASQEVLNGTTARLKCLSVSALNVNYTWLKDGKPLPHKSNRKYTLLPTGVLQIFAIDPSDAGQYACQASSSVGSCLSDSAIMSVLPSDANAGHDNFRFLHPPQNLTVMAHDNAIFECMTTATGEDVLYGWTRKDESICSADSCIQELIETPRKNNLIFKNVSPSKTGLYSCVASRISDSKRIKSAAHLNVLVLEKPQVTMFPKGIKKVIFSENLQLSCAVTGENSKMHWIKDGSVLLDNRVKKWGTRYYLDIATVRKNDLGYYQCIAENSIGVMSAGVRLDVVIKEEVPPPYNVSAVTLSARKVRVEWMRPNTTKTIIAYTVEYEGKIDGQTINGTKTSTILNDLTPFTLYTIKVVAYTSLQTSEESQPVSVQTGETRPCGTVQDIKAVAVNSSAVLLTWSPLPEELRCGVITYYKVVYVNGESETENVNGMTVSARNHGIEHTVITGLQAGANYGISMRAATKVGLGDESEFVDVTVRDAFTVSCASSGAVIKDFKAVVSKNPDTITVDWACVKHPFTKFINVTVSDNNGDTQSLSVLGNAEKVTFRDVDPGRLYIVNISVALESTICESHSFLALLSDEKKVTRRLVTDLNGNATDPGCVRLWWTYKHSTNGTMTYRIRYSLDKPHENAEKHINSSTPEATVCSLEAWSEYSFAVAVLEENDKRPLSNSDYSKEKFIWTAEESPGLPRDVRCFAVGQGTANCEWQQPTKPNGEDLYYILYYRNTVVKKWENITTKDRFTSLECLAPESTYIIHVAAANAAGIGQNTHDRRITILRYDVTTTNCTVEPPIEDPPDEDHMMAIIIGVSISAVCLLICVILLICCVPTSRCLQNEKRFCLKRRRKNTKQVKENGSNKQEEVILVPTSKNVAQNGRIAKDTSLDVDHELREEQSERLLSNGDAMRPNASNGFKNEFTKRLPVKKNGYHKKLDVPSEDGMDQSVKQHSFSMDDQLNETTQSGKGGSALLDNLVRSLTMKNRSIPVPETKRKEKTQNQVVLSVPIPKHTSKMGIYDTSSIGIPQSDVSDPSVNSSATTTSDNGHLHSADMRNTGCSTSRPIPNGLVC